MLDQGTAAYDDASRGDVDVDGIQKQVSHDSPPGVVVIARSRGCVCPVHANSSMSGLYVAIEVVLRSFTLRTQLRPGRDIKTGVRVLNSMCLCVHVCACVLGCVDRFRGSLSTSSAQAT